MKLLRITFQFQFADAIERLLDEAGVRDWTRHPNADGRDLDGKHVGSKAFPGSVTVVEAQVPEGPLEALLERLEAFRTSRPAHAHLTAMVFAAERRVGE